MTANGASAEPSGLTPRDRRTVAILLLVFPAPFSLLVIYGSLFGVSQSLASRRWPTVQGRIERSEVEERSRSLRPYKARIEYSYVVDDKTYVNDEVTANEGLASATREPAVRICRRYPAGAAVTVYYDPQNPADALLEPELSAGSCVTLLMGLVVLTGSILGALVLLGKLRSPDSPPAPPTIGANEP